MRWVPHILSTAAIASLMDFSPSGVLLMASGSILSDLLEFGEFISRHRGLTHCLSIWLFALVTKSMLIDHSLQFLDFIIYGSLAHILEDSLNPRGIPLFTPYGKRLVLGLFKVPSFGEYIFTSLCIT